MRYSSGRAINWMPAANNPHYPIQGYWKPSGEKRGASFRRSAETDREPTWISFETDSEPLPALNRRQWSSADHYRGLMTRSSSPLNVTRWTRGDFQRNSHRPAKTGEPREPAVSGLDNYHCRYRRTLRSTVYSRNSGHTALSVW